ncbi:DUF6452 family protein [Saccharicrinis fermentans]|uniref:DUF1735 domain-containing protein n=1 Tax=Saccharicrinis fermentans DSM 9555 = JCM 21142 TaxID=869213 RepID=W7Y5M0_9BACT|nr:DUF6452 family protein [Saccharicrinis fermentans]GAF03412.1 hypothetical protein JCM21142_42085 [Saccharicrinis fermentans DSM 9555 = JCM 21142]
MKIFTYVFLLLFMFLTYACGDDSSDFCLSNQQSVQVGFYSSYQSSDTDSSVSNVLIYSTGVDSILYDEATVSDVYLPLSMENDSSQFIIEINDLKDTISFVHQKELNFVSGECGFIFSFYLDTVMYSDVSFIDSVAIDYDEVVYNENLENVKIYLY